MRSTAPQPPRLVKKLPFPVSLKATIDAVLTTLVVPAMAAVPTVSLVPVIAVLTVAVACSVTCTRLATARAGSPKASSLPT